MLRSSSGRLVKHLALCAVAMCAHPLLGPLVSFILLFSVSVAVPTERRSANQTALQVQTYYNLNGTALDDKVNTLSADGYSVISLSAYGTPPEVNYAAIWAQSGGTPFEVIYDADEATYNAWFESWKSKGYVSTHIAVTGPADSAVYAGVMEDLDVTNWAQECGMTSPYAYDNTTNGIDMFVKSFSMYGSPSDRRYCILGHENIGRQQSTIFYSTTTYPIDYPTIYKSEIAKRFWRPSRLFVSDDHIITPQFVDTEVGRWVAKDGLTANKLSAEIASQGEQGLFPIDLHGGGSGDEAYFTVIFAEHSVPEARKWTATGPVNGFLDNEATTTAFDDTMRTWMQKNGVRQAQIGIALNGSTIAERSYTWAESNRAVVEPDDVFLLASVSKIFAYAAINNLLEAGDLELSTLVYPLLGYQPADARANNITVDHLLRHTAGYDRDRSGDVAFMFREVALSLFNGTRPATLRDMIEYQVLQTLDFEPGTDYSYSNYGIMLLGYLVTNVTGIPYLDYLQEHVLDGLDVQLYETAAEKHASDRIVQESKFTGYDPTTPETTRLVPGPYGGDGAIKEECASSFSLAASASTIARFIGKHAVLGTGGRAMYAQRDGSLSGARTFASSAQPEVDWALNLNTREFISDAEFDDLRFVKLPQVFSDHPIAVE